MNLDIEKVIDSKQDLNMTLKILCEEFYEEDKTKAKKKQQKRSKCKARRQIKTNETDEVRSFDQ